MIFGNIGECGSIWGWIETLPNPLYWLYLVLNQVWNQFWCMLLPEVCA